MLEQRGSEELAPPVPVPSSAVKDATRWFKRNLTKQLKCAVWNTCSQSVTLKCKGSACTHTLEGGRMYVLKCRGEVSTEFCKEKSQCEVAAISAPTPPPPTPPPPTRPPPAPRRRRSRRRRGCGGGGSHRRRCGGSGGGKSRRRRGCGGGGGSHRRRCGGSGG